MERVKYFGVNENQKYTVRIARTISGKSAIKINLADGSNKPVDLEATVILKRYLRKKPSTSIKLDANNAIEVEIIKDREHKLLSMMRALG